MSAAVTGDEVATFSGFPCYLLANVMPGSGGLTHAIIDLGKGRSFAFNSFDFLRLIIFR
jgi:hypothetical protein